MPIIRHETFLTYLYKLSSLQIRRQTNLLEAHHIRRCMKRSPRESVIRWHLKVLVLDSRSCPVVWFATRVSHFAVRL